MDKKELTALKIIMGVLAVFAVLNTSFYFIDTYALGGPSYYTQHFLSCVTLFCLGGIALLMPQGNTKKFSGDSKGENTVVICGLLLIVLAFVSILVSYIM